jgi:cytoskeletal protein CcmA (bactofilin family)
MERIAAVGASVVIKGELSASEDVVIAGRVEGSVTVEGHLVVVEPGGSVAADVVAKGVVVAGSVQGSVVAEERIELRSTARVEGELAAPRIAIADGATLSGKVETSKQSKAKLKAAS